VEEHHSEDMLEVGAEADSDSLTVVVVGMGDMLMLMVQQERAEVCHTDSLVGCCTPVPEVEVDMSVFADP
jgi:phosphoribosyl-AMP cyclohydrolase